MILLEIKAVLLDRVKVNSRPIYHAVKRGFDFIAATCGLILLSPVMLWIALLIKREDHGPIFYKQTLTGTYTF